MRRYIFLIIALLTLTGCNNTSESVNSTISESIIEEIVEENIIVENILTNISEYNGTKIIELNNNVPNFNLEDATTVFETYSELDSLGRCGVAYANICKELMPTEERGAIGHIKPSGWHTVKYNGIVDGNYLYNRCHLIAYCLAGENDNELNLVTGTRSFNVDSMYHFEDIVNDYMKANPNNHVLYRVTPLFIGNELVCRGVQMEAQSIEDNEICFNVFCYNVQDNIDIEYMTGESKLSFEPIEVNSSNEVDTIKDSIIEDTEAHREPSGASGGYLINTVSHKIHTSSCRYSTAKNVESTDDNIDTLIANGYEKCKVCNP